MRGLAWLPVLILTAQCILPAQAAESAFLWVTVRGEVPGINQKDLAPYLAQVMADSTGRHIVAALGSEPPPDRIEWHIWPNPYAGGAVRYLGPGRSTAESLFGIHRLISAELRLYRNGQYQHLVFGETEIRGGRNDPDFKKFIARQTEALLDVAD